MSLDALKDALVGAQYVSPQTLQIVKNCLVADTEYVKTLHKKFEKLPHIASRLYSSTFVDIENAYKPTTFDDPQIVADMNFLNGAWYAYLEKDI